MLISFSFKVGNLKSNLKESFGFNSFLNKHTVLRIIKCRWVIHRFINMFGSVRLVKLMHVGRRGPRTAPATMLMLIAIRKQLQSLPASITSLDTATACMLVCFLTYYNVNTTHCHILARMERWDGSGYQKWPYHLPQAVTIWGFYSSFSIHASDFLLFNSIFYECKFIGAHPLKIIYFWWLFSRYCTLDNIAVPSSTSDAIFRQIFKMVTHRRRNTHLNSTCDNYSYASSKMTQWTTTRRKYLVRVYCMLCSVCIVSLLIWCGLLSLSSVDSGLGNLLVDRQPRDTRVVLSNYTTLSPPPSADGKLNINYWGWRLISFYDKWLIRVNNCLIKLCY